MQDFLKRKKSDLGAIKARCLFAVQKMHSNKKNIKVLQYEIWIVFSQSAFSIHTTTTMLNTNDSYRKNEVRAKTSYSNERKSIRESSLQDVNRTYAFWCCVLLVLGTHNNRARQ